MSNQHPAVFLDRDGTLIEDVGALRDVCDLRLFADTAAALRRLRQRFALFVITNQCAVGEGLLTLADVERVHGALAERFRSEGIEIVDWYVCPHARDAGCACRKPGDLFLRRAAAEHGVDLSRSFIVGDHPSDALTGREHGVRGVYLLTGHGRKHRGEVPEGVPVFEHLGDAARWIDNEHRAAERPQAIGSESL